MMFSPVIAYFRYHGMKSFQHEDTSACTRLDYDKVLFLYGNVVESSIFNKKPTQFH
jgi:hypothetical protein